MKKREYTTYRMSLALRAYRKGMEVYVCHPDDPFTGEPIKDDPIRSEADFKEAEFHMFGIAL